ncbi:MAG TPA: TonB-dependent receptor [Rhizomicrobium sp.]
MNRLNTLLLSGVSIWAFGSAVAPAFAQDAVNSNEPETVVVTGIRASLQNSQSIKKNADVFVDSITAEDIGALPDRTVMEALQRVPGVSINYFAGANDPDHFSAEGSGISIRGLTQNQSLFNSRDAFTANNGRILSFNDVPAELMAGVDVFKSPEADMIEGGIGGSVNLRTRVPFDQDGQLIGLEADGSWGDKSHKASFSGSGLYSNRWDTSAGEFGFLVDISHSQLFTRSDGTQVAAWSPGSGGGGFFGSQGWTCPVATCYVPEGGDTRIQEYNRQRTGFATAAQWKSNDDTLLATIQFIRSDSKENWNEKSRDVAGDVVAGGGATPPAPQAKNLQPIQGTSWDFDGQGKFEEGYITELASGGWRSADPTVPLFGMQAQDITRGVNQEFVTNDFSGHVRWTPTNDWVVDFDAQHVWATTSNLDVSSVIANWDTVKLKMNGSGIPSLQFLAPSDDASQDPVAWFEDPGNYFWRAAMDHAEASSGHENAFRADAEYLINDGWLDSLKVGARYSDREQDVQYTTYNWGSLSEVWQGTSMNNPTGSPVWLGQNSYNAYPTWDANFLSPGNVGECCAGQTVPGMRDPKFISGGDLVKVFAYPNFQNGSVPTPTHGIFYAKNPANSYKQFVSEMSAIGGLWGGSWVPLSQRPCALAAGSEFCPNEVNDTGEKTRAAYAMLRFGDNQRISGNIGVRYVHTEDDSNGFIGILTSGGVGATLQGPTPIPQCGGMGTPPLICTLYAKNPAEAQQVIQFCNPVMTDTTTQTWTCQGTSQSLNATHNFNYLLPSLNAKIKLTDSGDMLVRFGLSQSIFRPDMGYLRDYQNITFSNGAIDSNGNLVGGFVDQAGNPNLKPAKSDNYDISYEYYFADAGSFTVAGFMKDLHGYMTDGFVSQDYTSNGVTETIVKQVPVNATTTGHIKGFEVAWQQFFNFLPSPFDGFGINSNYTYVASGGIAPLNLTNGSVNPGAIPGTGCSTGPCLSGFNYSRLPLDQLSKHNVNLEAIYEKGPISARLAWNWRSKFLLTARDVIYPFSPIFNEPQQTLDGSIFYSIDDHIKIGLQAYNIMNNITRTSQVIDANFDTAGRSWFTQDRRVSLVLRANY